MDASAIFLNEAAIRTLARAILEDATEQLNEERKKTEEENEQHEGI